MMKLITCTGYHGTGSSSVADLLKEYDNVVCKGEYEINLLYEYQGINDLYHHLIEEPVYSVGDVAIREYRDLCKKHAKYGTKMNYEKYFEGKFLECTGKYIERIGNECYFSYYPDDLRKMPRILYYPTAAINKIYQKLTFGKFRCAVINPFIKPGKRYLFTMDEESFIRETKKYLGNVFGQIDKKEYLFVDHIVSPSSIVQCSRYFDNLKVVLVDRDPRDIYLLRKYYWKDLPKDDIAFFCRMYQWKREMSKQDIENASNVLQIRFEDMINNYEKSVKKIENFIGLKSDAHIFPQKYFNPELSANNVQLWYRHLNEEKNIKYIEEHLSEYLYEGWISQDLIVSKNMNPW